MPPKPFNRLPDHTFLTSETHLAGVTTELRTVCYYIWTTFNFHHSEVTVL